MEPTRTEESPFTTGHDVLELQAAAEHVGVLRSGMSRRANTLTMHQMFSGIVAAEYLALTAGRVLGSDFFLEAQDAFRDIQSVSATEILNPRQLQRLLLQVALAEMAEALLPCVAEELKQGRLVPPGPLGAPEPCDVASLLEYLRRIRSHAADGGKHRGAYLIRLGWALQGSWVKQCPLQACEEALAVFRYLGSQEESKQKAPSPAMVRCTLVGARQILQAFEGDSGCLRSSNRLDVLRQLTDGKCTSGIMEITASPASPFSLLLFLPFPPLLPRYIFEGRIFFSLKLFVPAGGVSLPKPLFGIC